MTKYEIEIKIAEEMKKFLPSIGHMPFDKALPILQKKAWELADKYDTDGANVINLMLSHWKDAETK